MTDARNQAADALIKRTKANARELSDDDFRTVFIDAVSFLEMTDGEIAGALRISRPTVSRWKCGRNLPHPGFRGPVLKCLTRLLQSTN